MRTHLRATAHLYVLAAVVAACAAVAFGCAGTGNGLARLGGAGGGAALGAAVGGPLGAGVGAIAGDAGANLVIPPPPCDRTVNNITAQPGSNVQVGAPKVEVAWYEPWIMWAKVAGVLLAVLLAIPRTRPHVLGFLYSVAHAHPVAALAKAGAVLGWVRSKTADGKLFTARARRGKIPPPAVIVPGSQQVGPHA